jgi:hypothetical protein
MVNHGTARDVERARPRTLFLAFCAATCACVSPIAQAAGNITAYENPPPALRHALDRLSAYTGLPVSGEADRRKSVRVELNAKKDPRIEPQGYAIRSDQSGVVINGNDDQGAANGIYTLLRTLMIEHQKDPFARAWKVQEKPSFTVRGMLVSPYRFGASYGFAQLSPDRWSFEQWKQYVDLMRLTNMTNLTMGSTRVYDPEYPDSQREKFRYETWKQVMDYCHEIGMQFDWFMMPVLVPEQAFWDNPDKRFLNEGAWYGNGLDWQKGKDLILKTQKYTLSYFKNLDNLVMMYTDGGSFYFEPPGFSADPTTHFAEVTNDYLDVLERAGNRAKFINMNWGLQFWADLAIPKEVKEKYPRYKTIQRDTIPLLPKDAGWEDASVLTWTQNFGPFIKRFGDPPVAESLLQAKEAGLQPVIDLFWYMNPESAINMFPHPYIRRAIQEARYARDELQVDGAKGYRLAPPMRFVDDYVFFRVTSNASLTQEQIVSEVAGLLTEHKENIQVVKEAIDTLEQFWTTRKLEDIDKADELLRSVLPNEHGRNLEYVSNGVTFLSYIVRMAQPDVDVHARAKLKQQLYETIRSMYILQGLVADVVWVPEAQRFFSARVDMMVQDYNYFQYVPPQDVFDRSIYPQASSQPTQLIWPEASEADRRIDQLFRETTDWPYAR